MLVSMSEERGNFLFPQMVHVNFKKISNLLTSVSRCQLCRNSVNLFLYVALIQVNKTDFLYEEPNRCCIMLCSFCLWRNQ